MIHSLRGGTQGFSRHGRAGHTKPLSHSLENLVKLSFDEVVVWKSNPSLRVGVATHSEQPIPRGRWGAELLRAPRSNPSELLRAPRSAAPSPNGRSCCATRTRCVKYILY
jgi:hypothetical protein